MEGPRLFLFNQMLRLSRRGLLDWIPDAPYLRLQYYLKLGRRLHLRRPALYTEKLQWLKLHDRRADYPTYADKWAVRDFVAQTVGQQYLIPLLARYARAEEIDWAALPERFVLKCTHGSSCNIVCRDKRKLDLAAARRDIDGWMKRNWYSLSREWPYKSIPPRIIVEEFLESDTGDVPYDYKILCFGGEPVYIVVDADRYVRHTRNYYDVNWVKQDMWNRHPNCPIEIPRPARLAEMLDIARRLSRGIPHIRIDLYEVGGRVYFGEMTFFHGYGMEVYSPRSFEMHMGKLIALPKETNQR